MDSQYNMSFIGGSLLLEESRVAAELYANAHDWEVARSKILDDNMYRTRTLSTAKRRVQAVIQRLENLSEGQLSVLIDGNLDEKKQVLWFAICNEYRFIRDFATEVIREKYLQMDYELTKHDYYLYFHSKAEWDNKLENLSESTKKKAQQIIFRMLHEADLVNSEDEIQKPLFTERVIEALRPDAPTSFLIFPISEAELGQWVA